MTVLKRIVAGVKISLLPAKTLGEAMDRCLQQAPVVISMCLILGVALHLVLVGIGVNELNLGIGNIYLNGLVVFIALIL